MHTDVFTHAVAVVAVLAASTGSALAQYPVQNLPTSPPARGVDGYFRPTVSATFDDVPLKKALQILADRAGLQLLYEDKAMTDQMRVRVHLDNVLIDSALKLLTRGHPVKARLSSDRGSILVRHAIGSSDSIIRGSIIGRVIDTMTKEPVVNAVVTLLGTNRTAMTNAEGRFTLFDVVAKQYTLTVQRMGYTVLRRSVTVLSGEAIGVTFEVTLAVSHLEEVVATATGGQRRAEVGNAIASIKADSLVALGPITSLTDLLAARAPGVQVLRSGGSVGAPSRIRIRGVNSAVLNNDPIVIVDGVRINAVSTTGTGSRNMASGYAAPSPIDYLDPNTIESIDILKGPSAASLYGTDASNGVIIVKTKRGHAGPTRFTIRGDQGWSFVPGKFPEMYYGVGTSDFSPVQSTNCILSLQIEGACNLDRIVEFNPLNDKETTTQGMGSVTRVYTDVAGGWTALQYFLGATLDHSIGTTRLPKVELDRIREVHSTIPFWQERPNRMRSVNLSARINAQPTRDLMIQTTTQLLTNKSWDAQSGFNADLLGSVRTLDTLDYDPATQFATRSGTDRERAMGSIGLTYQRGHRFLARGMFGADYEFRDDLSHREPDLNCASAANCSIGTRTRYNSKTFDRTADFSSGLTIPLHQLVSARTTIGMQYYRTRTMGSKTVATGLVPGLGSGNSALQHSPPEDSRNDAATAGWYIDEQVAINDRLFLSVGLRQDVGSAFGQSAKLPVYPKINGSWVVSQESFFKTIPVISNFRLRAAYGHSGKQPTQTEVVRLYQPTQAYANGRVGPGLVLLHLGNVSLRPERGKEIEGGVDLGVFDDRILIEATAYRKVLEDALYGRVAGPSAGSMLIVPTDRSPIRSMRYDNLGTVENRGFELGVTGRIIATRMFLWEATINASANRNRVLKVATDTMQFGTPDQLVREGYPLFGQWRRPLLGYQDRDGNGILTKDEIILGDTAMYMGAPYPKSEITYSNTVQLFNGAVRVNVLLQNTNGLTTLLNRKDTDRGAVDPTAPLADQARAISMQFPESYDGVTTASSGYRQTVDWLRLSELSFTYMLPTQLTRSLRTRMASVSLLGRNLGMWTRYRGMDPEVNSRIGEGDRQQDNGSMIPQTREWMLRVNLSY